MRSSRRGLLPLFFALVLVLTGCSGDNSSSDSSQPRQDRDSTSEPADPGPEPDSDPEPQPRDPTPRPQSPTSSEDGTQLDATTAVISGNQAGSVDLAATAQYITAVIQNADAVWSAWFRAEGMPEPWIGYFIIQPGQTYTSNCNIDGQKTFGSTYANAFYCPADANQTDRGQIIFPVETMAKMWTGDIFTRQVSNLKRVGDFAAGMIVAHEFGHHIQDELTEFTGVQPPAKPNSELLADCFSGVWAYALNLEGLLEAGDIDEALNALEVIGDNQGDHGTPEQRKNAYLIGANGTQADPRGGVPGNCTTAFWPGFPAL